MAPPAPAPARLEANLTTHTPSYALVNNDHALAESCTKPTYNLTDTSDWISWLASRLALVNPSTPLVVCHQIPQPATLSSKLQPSVSGVNIAVDPDAYRRLDKLFPVAEGDPKATAQPLPPYSKRAQRGGSTDSDTEPDEETGRGSSGSPNAGARRLVGGLLMWSALAWVVGWNVV